MIFAVSGTPISYHQYRTELLACSLVSPVTTGCSRLPTALSPAHCPQCIAVCQCCSLSSSSLLRTHYIWTITSSFLVDRRMTSVHSHVSHGVRYILRIAWYFCTYHKRRQQFNVAAELDVFHVRDANRPPPGYSFETKFWHLNFCIDHPSRRRVHRPWDGISPLLAHRLPPAARFEENKRISYSK